MVGRESIVAWSIMNTCGYTLEPNSSRTFDNASCFPMFMCVHVTAEIKLINAPCPKDACASVLLLLINPQGPVTMEVCPAGSVMDVRDRR